MYVEKEEKHEDTAHWIQPVKYVNVAGIVLACLAFAYLGYVAYSDGHLKNLMRKVGGSPTVYAYSPFDF